MVGWTYHCQKTAMLLECSNAANKPDDEEERGESDDNGGREEGIEILADSFILIKLLVHGHTNIEKPGSTSLKWQNRWSTYKVFHRQDSE